MNHPSRRRLAWLDTESSQLDFIYYVTGAWNLLSVTVLPRTLPACIICSRKLFAGARAPLTEVQHQKKTKQGSATGIGAISGFTAMASPLNSSGKLSSRSF
jgi:hypothetical protein